MGRTKFLLLFLYLLSFSLISPQPAFADLNCDPTTGICGTAGDEFVSFKWLETLFKNTLSVVLTLVGLASFIMIILGAFRLLTAGANQESVQQGKATITYGLLGLFAAILVWVILYFLSQFTGLDTKLLEFRIDI